MLNAEDKNYLIIAIVEANAATAHGGIYKTMRALTEKFECQSFSRHVREYVGICNICQRTKYAQKGPITYVTPLHVLLKPYSDITLDFL